MTTNKLAAARGLLTLMAIAAIAYWIHFSGGTSTLAQAGANQGAEPQALTITEFPLPNQNPVPVPYGVTRYGVDHSLWFVEKLAGKIGRITTSGAITEYALPGAAASCQPGSLIQAGDDNLWFTETAANKIARIKPASVVSTGTIIAGTNFDEYDVPTANSQPTGMTRGTFGIWFTEANTSKLGLIQNLSSPSIVEFATPTSSALAGIAKAVINGNTRIYFAEISAGRIGYFKETPDGSVFGNCVNNFDAAKCFVEVNTPTANSQPFELAQGSDNNVWFTEGGAGKIGKMDAANTITEFNIPTANARPAGIVSGPDSALWFTEALTNSIGRITTTGAVTEQTIPTADTHPWLIACDCQESSSDTTSTNTMWFTENSTTVRNAIGKIDIGLGPTPTPTPAPFTLSFEGRLRDRVSRTKPGLGSDGDADGTFGITFPDGFLHRTVTKLDLVGPNGNRWDTNPANRSLWTIGVVTPTIDSSLDNQSNGSVNFDTANGNGSTRNFYIMVPDSIPSSFVQGKSFTLNITFADGQTVSAGTTIGTTPANSADLRVEVVAASNPIQVDTIENYTVHVQNLGPSTATNVKATITLPAATSFIDFGNPATTGCQQTVSGGRQFICTYPSLAINATVTAQFRTKAVTTTSSDSSLGRLDAGVTSDLPDPIAANSNVTNTVSIVTNTSPPANDNFANAQGFVGGSGTLTGTNVGATKEKTVKAGDTIVFQPEPNHAGQEGGKSVWYTWRPPTPAGNATIDTQGSAFDTMLAVYDLDTTNPAKGVNIVNQNDDFYTDGTSKVDFSYRADHLYIIAIDGFKGATGNFNLNLSTTPISASAGQAVTDITGIFPAQGSKLDVDPQTGYFIMHVKGSGFTSQSQVLIDLDVPVGTTLDGTRAAAITQFISPEELIFSIPPIPVFDISTKSRIDVITPVASGGSIKFDESNHPESVAPGTYSLAARAREFDRIFRSDHDVQPGETAIFCAPTDDPKAPQTCVNYTNTTNSPITISPSLYHANIVAEVPGSAHNRHVQILGDILDNGVIPASLGFAVNTAAPLAGTIDVSQGVDAPSGSPPALLVTGGVASLLAGDGAGAISQGGGNVISHDGGTLIAAGGGNVTVQGGNLIGQDGGGLIGHDGGSKAQSNAFSGQSSSNGNIPTLSAADLQVSGGWFVVRSSGNAAPAYTSTVDPVDGTTKGKLSVRFDNTSNPRISDLQGLAFAAAIDPPILQLAQTGINVNKDSGHATVTITRTGPSGSFAYLDYGTIDGTASARSDYEPKVGTLSFAPGETTKSFDIPIINNNYGAVGDTRAFGVVFRNPYGAAFLMPNQATITIKNNQTAGAGVNPLDGSDQKFFIRQQYLDFLNREPDQSGWDFWSNTITTCGSDQGCIEVKRINASAAFFLSIEFQQTDYLVYRLYKTAYGNLANAPVPISYSDFLPDSQEIGQDVIVGQTGWDAKLEANKQLFANDFVNRQRFKNAFPASMTPAQFVDQMNTNAGNVLSPADRNQLVSDLTSGARTRAQALRAIAENQALYNSELNRAFVLMEYFGYLRRDPNSGPDTDFSGYNFWLGKLNSFNGDYLKAEMVKAFLSSIEYRQRFAP
ncbi:MAG TPA: Calx-beta domain-containing protein [Pyrinomonadaceae bacterium]|nr:Calx-beta domain-containing protein [Pyrinomonadaceae bacterium]